MPILKVDAAGSVGIVDDILPYMIPPNAWSFGRNVRFNEGSVVKFSGNQVYYDTSVDVDWDGGVNDIVYFVLPVVSGSSYYWIYCGLNDVRVFNGTTTKEITNITANFNGTAAKNWTGGLISGIPVLNNGIDEPQYWDLNWAGNTRLLQLPGWTNGDYCGALRVYKNYLIAMDVTKSSTRYPAMVKWSDGAALGNVPQSWNETDATKDAGENDLAESRTHTNVGAVIDCMPLRDANILYTDSSVWSMQYIGGSLIFQFRELFQNVGILSRRCMAEFEGKHFVVGVNDVYVHNGSTYQSVIDGKRKEFFYGDMDADHYRKTYVYANYKKKEMWVCYVESGHASALPNKALIWSWEYNTWGIRELPNSNATVALGGYGTPHIEGGVADLQSSTDAWDSDAETGTSDTLNGSPFLADSTASWTVDEHVGKYVYNTTDGSIGTITSNTSQAVYGALSGGTTNLWYIGDSYIIDYGWDTWTTPWGQLAFDPLQQSPVMAANKLYKGDSTNQFNGTNIRSVITRTDLPLGEQDEFVRIKTIYPRINGNAAVDVVVGVQMAPGGTVDYQNAVSFTPGTDQKVDVRKTGTHMAIRFESAGDQEWHLAGYDVEYVPVSRR